MVTSASIVSYSLNSKTQTQQVEKGGRGKECFTTQRSNVSPVIDCKFAHRKLVLLLATMCLGLDTHPARMNTHMYTVYGGAAQDKGQYVYLIDEHKK